METDLKPGEKKAANLGRNTQRIQEMIGMKQSALASNTGYSQQYISKLEQSETFADDILEKIADGLGVTPDLIKNFNEEKAIYNIQSNCTYNDNSTNSSQHYYPTFNNDPIDKVIELFEKFLHGEKERAEMLSNVNNAIHDLGEQLNAMKGKDSARE